MVGGCDFLPVPGWEQGQTVLTLKLIACHFAFVGKVKLNAATAKVWKA